MHLDLPSAGEKMSKMSMLYRTVYTSLYNVSVIHRASCRILDTLLMDAAAELGRNLVSKHQIQPEYGDEQADAGRDG